MSQDEQEKNGREKTLRLPWRGTRISVFWRFGIKVTKPKRTVASQSPQVSSDSTVFKSRKEGLTA